MIFILIKSIEKIKCSFLKLTCMTKSRLNLLFSTPVMNVTETYDLSNEQYKHLTSQEDLYQTTGDDPLYILKTVIF